MQPNAPITWRRVILDYFQFSEADCAIRFPFHVHLARVFFYRNVLFNFCLDSFCNFWLKIKSGPSAIRPTTFLAWISCFRTDETVRIPFWGRLLGFYKKSYFYNFNSLSIRNFIQFTIRSPCNHSNDPNTS